MALTDEPTAPSAGQVSWKRFEEDRDKLRSHFSALDDKGSYDAFIRGAHELLQRIGADPYHVRMALQRGKSLMEFGSRAAYRHSEGVGGIRVGLLMMEADVPQVPQNLNPNVRYFDPRGETAIVKFTVPTWADIPHELLALNEKAMRWEYERIKDTKLVEIRRGSGTDNEALKYAVVNGVAVNELPQPGPMNELNQNAERMSIPLNRILYGPPGTGKTYHTIGKALEVCDPKYYAANEGNDVALRKRFNELLVKDLKKAEGQIAFCTFHQSFSYEDFVEGIKPIEAEEDSVQPLRYHTRPGILKEMARRAMSRSVADGPKHKNTVSFTPEQYDKAEVFKLSLGDSQNPEDQLIYDYCIKNNCVAIGFMYQHDLTGKSEQEVRSLPLQADQSSYHSKAMNFFSQYLNEGDIVVVTKGLYVVRAIGIVTGPYRYDPKSPIGYPHFRDVKWLMVDAEVPYEELYTRQFSQQSIYKMKKSDLKRDFFVRSSSPGPELGELKNFVLIIDEINRGNVAGIFGELITLVEENKRKGRPEALEVTLPYSQEPFSIPDNLYLIGTMNTADRSVEALDAALRRRFSFVPMMPDTKDLKPLQSTRIDIHKLLNRLNERLVQLLDEDHQIGHSHFWEFHKEKDPVPALQQVFKDKIIPQLEEYFHRDRSKLQMVLGERFVKGADADPNLFLGDDQEGSFEPRRLYTATAKETWDEAAFLSIYEKA